MGKNRIYTIIILALIIAFSLCFINPVNAYYGLYGLGGLYGLSGLYGGIYGGLYGLGGFY